MQLAVLLPRTTVATGANVSEQSGQASTVFTLAPAANPPPPAPPSSYVSVVMDNIISHIA